MLGTVRGTEALPAGIITASWPVPWCAHGDWGLDGYGSSTENERTGPRTQEEAAWRPLCLRPVNCWFEIGSLFWGPPSLLSLTWVHEKRNKTNRFPSLLVQISEISVKWGQRCREQIWRAGQFLICSFSSDYLLPGPESAYYYHHWWPMALLQALPLEDASQEGRKSTHVFTFCFARVSRQLKVEITLLGQGWSLVSDEIILSRLCISWQCLHSKTARPRSALEYSGETLLTLGPG